MQTWWILSLVVEFGVLASLSRKVWRRMYPAFAAYLALDLSASITLFIVAEQSPQNYASPWMVTQLAVICGRLLVVLEAYRKLAASVPDWTFPAFMNVSVSIGAAAIFHAFMRQPMQWPDSYLEVVFSLLALSGAILGFFLITVIISARDQNANAGPQFRHLTILCSYLLGSSLCYYTATRYPHTMGYGTLVVAIACYSAWLACLWKPVTVTR